MKKIYLLVSSALLMTVTTFAQNGQSGQGLGVPNSPTAIANSSSHSNSRVVTYDTTGTVNIVDFSPNFASVSNSYTWYTFNNRPNGTGGFCFGNNYNGWDIWAQGYANLNNIPVKIVGVIGGFRKKKNAITTPPTTSAVKFYLYSMAANQSYNTTGTTATAYNSTVANWPGPNGAAVATATLLFSAIDTTVNVNNGLSFPRANYIPFSTQPTFTGDFAIGMDSRANNAIVPTGPTAYLGTGGLAPGDTIAMCTDVNGDANNLDYCYTLGGYNGATPKWYVADQWNSSSPGFSGTMDLDMALFAVFENATGVNEFYNGMKLTTYPNPSVEKATIEYTLEKNSNNVRLSVMDEHGAKIVDNEYGAQAAGTYKIDVATGNLAAGMYFYQLKANGRNFTKQLIVTNKN